MKHSRPLSRVHRAASIAVLPSTVQPLNARGFRSWPAHQTDGVYQELTAMRVRIPWVEALRRQREEENGVLSPPPTSPARDLSPKKMSDSFHSVILPLARDPWLSDNYMNSSGHIRLGTLFMDLDALSGVVAYKHTGDSVMTVTAAVDRITIKHPLQEICDLRLSGQVTFATGRSSMEISMQVAKVPNLNSSPQPEDIVMTCAFTMVSLDPSTKKPVSLPPLQIDTPEEQRLFALGQKNYEAKKALSKMNLRKTTPNDKESDLIHSMWLKQLEYLDPNQAAHKPENVVYMEKTRLHSAQIMHPKHRNFHQKIFGGFLLKITFDLAFCCAASFSHSRPVFISLDPSTFDNPVPVGSVLYLGATVTYTEEGHSSMTGDSAADDASGKKYTKVQIRVDSKVRDVEHDHTKPTGLFHYTFLIEKDIKVMPRTYSEFMTWTDARRRAHRADESIGNSDIKGYKG